MVAKRSLMGAQIGALRGSLRTTPALSRHPSFARRGVCCVCRVFIRLAHPWFSRSGRNLIWNTGPRPPLHLLIALTNVPIAISKRVPDTVVPHHGGGCIRCA